jgi:hypothetical protein
MAALLFFVMFSVFSVQGQVDVTGAVTGNGSYTTLGAAFTAIGTSQASANISISITGNTTETAIAVLGAGTWTSLTISPSGGAWTISGSLASELIQFNGADNVTINGLNTGGDALTISNTSTAATSGTSTIKFQADATNNTITNCSILGSGTMAVGTNGGVIYFGTATTTGNDGNTISYCNLGPAGANLPSKLVYANGSTTNSTIANSGITITNCNMYDCFLAGGSASVYALAGNTDWNITNNKLYQTASRSHTGTAYGIYFANSTFGNNIQITGNTIGYANNAGTGTYTLTGAGTFYGISLTALSTAANACNINSNTITDIASASTGSVYGINNSTSASSNTININTNTVKNIALSGTATFYGIAWGSATNLSASNNNVYSISRSGAGTMYGIYSGSSSTNETVNGNSIHDFTSTSASAGTMYGISQGTAVGTKLFQNNTIYNFSGNAGMTFYGISVSYGTTVSISGNTIYGFTNTGGTGGTFYGINRGTTATTENIYNNKIYGFSTTSTGPLVNGIVIAGGTTTNVYNNIIGGLTASAANVADAIRGISCISTTATTASNVYYNTIYLNASSSGATFGSTGIYQAYSATATSGALDMRNNIIDNASTANGTGLAVAFRRSAATDLNNYATTSNNNMFYGTSGIYYNGTTTYASAAFQTLVSTRETASKFQNPLFDSTTGSASNFLHFTTGGVNLAGNNGQVIAGYTTDFDGDLRNDNTGVTPTLSDIGADEWANGTITAPTITSFSPLVLCVAGGQSVTLTGTGFDTATAVKFNGADINVPLSGTITASTATSLTVTTPAGVVDGYITVVNPAGQITSSGTYTTATAPTIGVSSAVSICSGTSTSLVATGGVTYTWSPATALSATTGDTVTASPTTATTYTVTGYNAAGCPATATVAVSILPVPSAVTVTKNPTAICVGGITTLTAAGGTVPTPVSTYGFAGSTGTYTAITGTTLSATAIGDDVGVGNLPIGFTFPYNGSTQTVFAASSNGLLLLGNTTAAPTGFSSNALASTANVISPLWDDNNTTGGSIIYSTTGTAPNRVLTVQWTGMHVAGTGSSTNPTINMQALLYENGNIQFIYGAQSAALSSPTCSIGISGASGNYISVSPLSPINTSTVSTSTENTSVVTANIPSGTILTFTKPANPVLLWSPSTDLYTDAAATVAYSGGTNTVVYAKNLSAQTYTASATLGTCAVSGSATVTPNVLPTVSVANATICSGGAGATLTASGASTYTWSPALGLNGTTGTSVTANPTTNSTYTITGTDANGCINTTTATVTVNTPVAITVQPSNQVVLENASASFSVTATGTGLTYQWQVNDGSGWADVDGETSATYAIASAPSSLNGYYYRCTITGTCSTETSTNATLTVGSVSITAQPTAQTICSNSSATFSVTTSGDVTSYQWQVSTNGTTWSDVSGADAASVTISGLTAANTGNQYRCVLNAGAVTSNPAGVTVYDAVTFGTQPSNQSVCAGAASVTFTAAATASGLAYQWEVSTNGTTWNTVSGATAATYTINTPSASLNNNQYRVIASGTAPCSAVTSDVATLTVTNVTVAASPAAICVGGSTTVSATFTGAPDYATTSWTSTTGSGAETAVSGTSASVTPTAAGTYVYTFASNGTCPFTKTVSVTVNALPIISSATATPATVCSDAAIALAAASIANANGTAALGAGATLSSSTANSVFPGAWGGAKTQYLIKASELTALGFAAGNLTSIAFEPTTSGQTYQGFFVSIASTSATALTTTFLANGTQVYAGTLTDNGYTPVANSVNTLAFGTGSGSASSFAWDGTSNIVLTFSWSRVPSATTSTSSTMKSDTAAFVCTTYKQADSQTPAAMLAQTTGTTSSSRPRFTFGGVLATNFASTYTWSWNSSPAVTAVSGTTSVTNTSGSAMTQAFTATATNAAGCTASLTTSAVTINTTIPAPTGTDSTQCGTVTPTCSVAGTGTIGNTFHWYTVALNGTAIAGQTGSTLSSYPVAATTTFYVSEVSADGLCESPRTAVIVTVNTPYAFTLNGTTATNCSGSASLTPIGIATNGGYTSYSWSNAATVSGNETTGWTFSPTTTTTYTVTATGGGCSTTAQVVVTPVALPVVTATASPAAVCVGAPATITALTPVIGAGTGAFGTGALTSSGTGASMFPGGWGGAKSQYIIKASELTAQGFVAGNLTSLAFEPTTSGQTYQGFTVNVSATTDAASTATFLAEGTQVYAGTETDGGYTPTANAVNTLAFGTGSGSASSFSWNGTSNVVVTFSWSRVPSATTSTASTVKYYAPGFTCGVYKQSDSLAPVDMLAQTTGTTTTSRPFMTLGGQKTIQGVGTLAYTWNDASSTTGNVLTVSPSTTTTYTVYGYNGTTGCTGSTTSTVTVYAPPTAPSATNAPQCGTRVPLVAVADTNGYTTPTFKWYADDTTTTALQTSTSTTYTTSVSATTTFYVSVVSPGGCESPRTAVTTTVVSPATLTVSPATTVCTGGSTTLIASGAVSYTWTPALGLNGTTGASVIASPSANTTYSVTGVDENGCTTAAATVAVTVAAYPSALTITQGAASVCTDSVMSLTATGGTIGTSGNATIGAGTSLTSSTSYPAAFANYWYKNWQQYLFTKADLNAAGITSAGNISSLKFNIAALQDTSVSITDYNVKIAATSSTALSTFTTTGLTNVYGPAAVSPVVGVNTITFSTPFAWDGNSNIIVDIRQSEGYGNGNATTYYTTTTNNSVVYAYDSSNVSTFYTSVPTATTSTSRPNVVLGYSSTTPTTITWSPTTDLYTTVGATTAYAGGNASVVYTKPSAEVTYTATAANGACTTSATTTVTPVALPSFTLSGDVAICNGQSTTLEAVGSGYTYVWTPALGLNGTTTASVSANPAATTTYTVEATDTTTGCKAYKSVTVTVSQPGAILTAGTTTSQLGIPAGSTSFTVATAPGASYTYQWQVNDGSGWANLANDSNYDGVTTATLAVTDIQQTWDGYLYQCLVTGASPCATLTPVVATLTISSTGIATQPQSATVCAPGTASFNIVTNGDDPYGIQWQMSTDNGVTYADISNGTDASGMTFSGVDTATLDVSDITLANNNVKFICMLNFYLLSDSATLTVKQPVVIGTQPVNQTVCATGGTATFTAAATGDNLAYQWEVSTNGTTWANYAGAGATSASISIVNPALAANGTQYRVVVSGNAVCSSVTSSAATLFINNPTITTAPTAATVLRGNTASFTVAASAATSYQWQRSATLNGTYVNVVDATPTGNTYLGADTATLSVATSATTATGGGNYYRCVVTNNGCTVTSTGALLTVNWYCTPAPSSVDGTGITNVTMGDINNTTGAETGNYGDYTAYSTSADQLATVNFAITYATGYTYGTKIWIDFNDNGVFTDSGEQVYYGLSTSANPTTLSGSFTIPLTAAVGSHRMRISGSDTDTGVDPCYTSSYATFEDYTFNVNPAPTCEGTPVAGTAAAANTSLCSAGTGTTLTLSGYTTGVTNIALQWYMSTNGTTFAPVSGATSASLSTGSLTVNTSYYCAVTCTNTNETVNSNTVAITINDPLITASTPAGRCGTGTVTLEATANDGATINWYSVATNGTVLGTGTSFTTPSISATTTYYAEANTVGGLRSASGLGNTSIPTSTGASSERGIVFTATSNGTIVSAQYYSPTLNVTNAVTVRLVDNTTGTQVGSSVSLSIAQGATAGFYTMNLNLPVTAGTTYRLLAGFSQSVNRISTGANYATAAYNNLGALGTITSGYDSAVSTTSYNYFHNIVALVPGCTSARTAVVATVTPTPTATISYTTPLCSTAGTASVVLNGTNAYTGGTFSSTAGLTLDSVTGAIDVATSTPGTYTVTYTTNPIDNCGAQTATTSVTINQALTSDFAYDTTTYCTNQGVATPTVTGTAGTFTATPAGLSINATTGAITLASSAAGTYTITNTVSVAGCANSVSTTTVTINNAVVITSQPINVSQLPGDNTSFSVAATGTGLTYQWEMNDGSGWAAISGETATTLSLTAVTSEMNSYQYRVIVSGATACTSVTSNAATLTVNTAAVATHPVNFTACSEGANTASFSVTTTGTVTSYQWQVSTNGTTWSDITNGGIYADADTATLLLSGLSLSNDANQFRCVLNGAVNSNPATLTIKTAVAITTQPSNTTGCSAGSASFTVAASGSSVSYQWQVSTNGTTWTNVSGATAATLTLNSLTFAMNGYQYQAVVSGASPCGPLTSSVATLTVNTAVAVSVQPVSTTVCNATNATFAVTATGTAPTYQWQMSTNGITFTDMSGETAASLTVSAVTVGMSGYQYRAVVSGAAPCGPVNSSAATLTVSQPAVPTIGATSLDFCTNGIVTLTAGNIGTVNTYANSFDALPSNFATAVVGTGTPTAVLSTTLKAEGTGSVRFNTTSTSANVAYAMNANLNLSTSSTATVTFSHIAAMEGPTTSYDYGYVEYSADGGTTWVTFPSTAYTGTAATAVFTGGNARFSTKSYADWISGITSSAAPANTLWKNETLTVPAAALTSQFRIRFRYTTDSSTNYYGWMIDNVKVTVPNATTWSPTTGLYTNAAATTAYTGGNAGVVYAKPTASSTYTVTTANALGCTNTGSVSLNLLTPATLGSIAQSAITCSGAQTTFNLTGLLPSSTSTLSYTVNGGTAQTKTGVVADASGNASFTLALAAFTNGQTLAITAIQRTDLTPNCTTAITANNTVTIAVQPLVTYYADADGDGFGNNAVLQVTCQGQPVGYVTDNTDCDDNNAAVHATYPFYADTDADGYGAGSAVSFCVVDANAAPAGYVTNNTDCNDADNSIHSTSTYYVDADADGYGSTTTASLCSLTAPAGYATNNTDCNDADNTVHTPLTYYVDADGDTFGSTTTASVCSATATAGYSTNNTDCNDADANVHSTSPYYVDVDADGYDDGRVFLCAVTAPTGYIAETLGSDCNDNDATVHYAITYYVDADGDGFDAGSASFCSSTAPAGYAATTNGTDCNDAVYSATNTCSSIVNLKLNIQGYYDADAHAMRPVMANQGVGTSTTDVDDVTVELRDASTNALVASATARLHTDGTATATFGTAPSGSFYIAVKHRNAVQTWSATPQTVGATPLTYDFSTAANKAYGDNMIQLESGVYGFYTGDLNQDESIDIYDFPSLFNDSDAFSSGYLSTDLNGDGAVDIYDFPLLFNNSDNFIFSNHP